MKYNINSANIIIAISIILAKINTIETKDDIKCNKKSERKMDSAAAKLIVIGQKNLKFPENAQQLRVYCNEGTKFINYITKYSNKCMPEYAKQVARIVTRSINNEMKAICKSGKLSAKAKELLKAASCANSGLDSFQKCNLDVIDAYMGIPNADVKMRIPMACCHFHKMRECFITEAEENKVCTKATIDFVDRYFYSIAGGMMDFLCYQYDESSEKCAQLVRDTPKRNMSVPRPKSIFSPVIAVWTSIGDIPDLEL